MSLVENRLTQTGDLIFLDTKNFIHPIAIAALPFRIKSQGHGSWVNGKDLDLTKPLVAIPEAWPLSNMGALEPLEQ